MKPNNTTKILDTIDGGYGIIRKVASKNNQSGVGLFQQASGEIRLIPLEGKPPHVNHDTPMVLVAGAGDWIRTSPVISARLVSKDEVQLETSNSTYILFNLSGVYLDELL